MGSTAHYAEVDAMIRKAHLDPERGSVMIKSWLSRLGIDPDLGIQALTHPSYAKENDIAEDSDRLEWLGDKVLSAAIAERLYQEYPKAKVDVLSRLHQQAVSNAALARTGRMQRIQSVVRIGRGVHRDGGSTAKVKAIADAVEAVIGAVFVSQGYAAATQLIKGWVSTDVEQAHDWKAILASSLQKQGMRYQYRTVRTGPEHASVFMCTLTIGSRIF